MSAQRAETSERYEKLEDNVFRMKPIGAKPRAKILTRFGQTIFNVTITIVVLAVAAYAILR